jgi:hypothetical protein
MKKFYVSLLAFTTLLLPSTTWADTVKCLVLTESSGIVNKFALADSPIVTYEGNDLIVTCKDQTLTIGLEGLKLGYGEMETSNINNIVVDGSEKLRSLFSFGVAQFEGLQPGTSVRVYSISGKCLDTVKADGNGRLVVSLNNLPKGIYIIYTPTRSFKIKN